MTKKHKTQPPSEDEFDVLIEKEEHREAWEHKHEKEKSYRIKYEEDDDDEEWQ